MDSLSGISKPLTKLIEVIAKGISAYSIPFQIRKTADARAYEIKLISDTIKESQDKSIHINYHDGKLSIRSIENAPTKSDMRLEDRTLGRFYYQEQKKQRNYYTKSRATVGKREGSI